MEGADRTERIPEELRDSAERIIKYAHISHERAELLRSSLASFRLIRDKFSADAGVRRLREALSALFFEIYEVVFKKVVKEKNSDRLFQLFLSYGFMDEKLLRPNQIKMLYELPHLQNNNQDSYVYSIDGWLKKIYRQEKDPSVNQFGKDYYDVFREMKKNGEITDKDKRQYDNDIDARLRHEINNLFKMGQRLCYGRMTGYFPLLYSDMVTGDLSRALMTPQKLKASLESILKVDFSAFHREIVYYNQDRGVKELVMKPVLPELILVPTFGQRAAMWQELTGRVSASPARFIFPVFTAEDVDNLMLDVVARFRWELSKSTAGFGRNNSQEGTLYFDYSDYVQFYKKNRDLSPEVRAKIKLQLDKCRNSASNMFVSDYRTWITYESKGLMRLNKTARSLMFKYCPFARPIRNQLEKQPLYNPLITRLNNNHDKQIRFLEARYAKLTRPGTPLDMDLVQNLAYYRS